MGACSNNGYPIDCRLSISRVRELNQVVNSLRELGGEEIEVMVACSSSLRTYSTMCLSVCFKIETLNVTLCCPHQHINGLGLVQPLLDNISVSCLSMWLWWNGTYEQMFSDAWFAYSKCGIPLKLIRFAFEFQHTRSPSLWISIFHHGTVSEEMRGRGSRSQLKWKTRGWLFCSPSDSVIYSIYKQYSFWSTRQGMRVRPKSN